MTTTTHDPIVAEVRAARARHAARFGYDVQKIFHSLQAQQRSSGRAYVRYPARPAMPIAAPTSELTR